MDDVLRDELELALDRLIRLAPGLDDLLVPRQASSGENAGKPPAQRGSKLPIVVSFLDLKLQTFAVVNDCYRWLRHYHVALAPLPSKRDIGDCCDWLLSHLDELGEQSWSARSAELVIAQSLLVADVIAPPPSLNSPTPPEVGNVDSTVRWLKFLGRSISRATLYRWIESGKIAADYRPDGVAMVRLADVLQAADM
ncbi:hypothetical protein [Corynebacterium sp.]|uniref:hypothetical protein n=1 Tax=Corynebacterium sp. TaxID=1720 RepID=UPI0028AB0EFA|nr:hypothetical protein [Corynebacterium sp.]